LAIDKLEISAKNCMAGIKLFGGGEALGGILYLSPNSEFRYIKKLK
jgi:hypothetical protein